MPEELSDSEQIVRSRVVFAPVCLECRGRGDFDGHCCLFIFVSLKSFDLGTTPSDGLMILLRSLLLRRRCAFGAPLGLGGDSCGNL
jgi:hypothetical protein